MTQTLPRIGRRSRFSFDFDAAYCLSRPDQSLNTITGQVATFTRTTTTTASDTAGGTQTFVHSQAAFEWADLDGDGLKEITLLLGSNDRLYHAYGGLPSARTFYLDLLEKTPTSVISSVSSRLSPAWFTTLSGGTGSAGGGAPGSVLLAIGDFGSAGSYLHIRRTTDGYDAVHHNGTTSVTATLTVTVVSGDRIQLRLIVANTGALTLAVKKNTDAEIVGSATGTNTFAAAWNQARLAIGSDFAGGNRASQAIRTVREYSGNQSLAFMAVG